MRAVNAQTDPALVEQLLSGRLDEVPCPSCARPIHVEVPVILHDAAREVFCEIHPTSARTSELRIHAALMAALAEEPVAVPPYVRESSLVFGRERAAQLYRSGGLSGGRRPRDAATSAHGERERALEERERALDEGETAASARGTEADHREQRLDERQTALDRREDEMAQRLRDAEGRVRKTSEREREIEAAAESARRREADLDSRSVELVKRENELSGEITDAEHREQRFREMREDIDRREGELAALAEQLREREQALDARHGAGDADRSVAEPAAALLSRLEQLTRRTGRAILPAERGVLLGRTLDRRDIDRAVENAPDLTIQLRVAESYPVVVLAAHLPGPGGPGQEIATWALDVADADDNELFERVTREFIAEVVFYDIADTARRASFTFAAPLAENARYVRARAEALVQPALARGSSFLKAMEAAVASPPDLAGRLTHAFTRDSFAELASPARALDALRVVAHWSAPENFDFLVAVRCFPLVYYRSIVTRVLSRAVEFGLAMDDVCTGLALAAGLAPTREALCELSLGNFAEVCLKLRPNDLEAVAEWENWRRLLARATEAGVRPGDDQVRLSEEAHRRAESVLRAAPEPPPPAAEPPARLRLQLEREAARVRARGAAPPTAVNDDRDRHTVRAAPVPAAAPPQTTSGGVGAVTALAAVPSAVSRSDHASALISGATGAPPLGADSAELPIPDREPPPPPGPPGFGSSRRITIHARPGGTDRELGAEARAWTQGAPPATVALRQSASEGSLAAILDLCDQPDPEDLPALLDGARRAGPEQLLRVMPALLTAHRRDERLETFLIEELSSRRHYVRQAAAMALAILATPRAPDALLELLLAEEEELAKEVALALGLLGRKAMAVLRRAAVRTTKADVDARERLARALANIGARGEEAIVKSIMTDDESGASAVAARAVKIIPGIALELVSDGPAGPERTYTRKILSATAALRRLVTAELRNADKRIDTREILGTPTEAGVRDPGSGPRDAPTGVHSSPYRAASGDSAGSSESPEPPEPLEPIEELDSGLLQEDGPREATVPRALYPSAPGSQPAGRPRGSGRARP